MKLKNQKIKIKKIESSDETENIPIIFSAEINLL